MHVKTAFGLVFLIFLLLFALVQGFLLIGRDLSETGDLVSILMSGALCVMVMLVPTMHPDALAPPRLLALLVLLFFPIYALLYLQFPELGKWYAQYFPGADLTHNIAVATLYTVVVLPCFLLGFLWGEARVPLALPAGRLVATRAGSLLLLVIIAAGLAGMLDYARSIGGIGAVMAEMDSISNRKAWREVASKSYYAGMFLMTAPTILALVQIQLQRGALRIAAASGVMVLSSGLLMVTQASREKAIFPLILFSVALLILSRGAAFRSRRRIIRLVILGTTALLCLAFAMQTGLRAGGETSSVSFLRGLKDFNRIDVSMVMFIDYFEPYFGNGVLFGLPILDYPAQVPARLLGVDLTMNTSEILNAYIFAGNPDAGNPGSPLAGELYMNFGLAGYLGFLGFGYAFGRMHGRLHATGFAFWPAVFYSAALYFFMFKLCIYTGLSESVLMILLVFAPLWLWRRLLRIRL